MNKSTSYLNIIESKIDTLNRTIDHLALQVDSQVFLSTEIKQLQDSISLHYKTHLNNTTTIDSKTIITVFVTSLIFSIGIFINWTIRKLDRRSGSKLIKDVCEVSISEIKQPILKQALICRKLANDVRSLQDFYIVPLQIVAMTNQKMNEIKIDSLFNTFINNLKGDNKVHAKDLFEMLRCFDYFNASPPRLEDNFTSYRDEVNLLISEWNQSVREYNEVEIEINAAIISNSAHPNINFVLDFNKIRSIWRKPGNNGNIESTFLSLIQPMLTLIQHSLSQNPNNDLASKVSPIAFNQNLIYMKWKVLQKGTYSTFIDLAITYVSTYKKLDKVNNKNKLKKLKQLYQLK